MRTATAVLLILFGLFLLLPQTSEAADSSALPVVIDATRPAPAPQAIPFAVGGRSPDGRTLAANSRYLMLDGKPWLPVMGEFHFARYPESGWEDEILKMKAAGVTIVSTYIFWIHHEEMEGEFDWSGRRDLRKFVELCAKHGMLVWIRIGPWDHGEVRNGGFPDWLLKKCKTRENDPVYLKYVRRFYGQIGQQVKGLLWKDGGPIIGVQLENEYSATGPGKGPEHILTLLKMAREAGLEAPFYTVTGWDRAGIPAEGVLPVYGGYADGFWYRSLGDLPPDSNYFFSKHKCRDRAVNALCGEHAGENGEAPYPLLTAEMGGGMASAYHRRPAISADDTAAMELVKLGSDVALYGFYMFHGGTNPDGKMTTLQETQATGYNDLPVKTYDFQAPLGEFGQLHASYRAVKTLNLFVDDFGSQLAPMATYLPDEPPKNEQDTATPRVAARLEGDHGFLFVNNYQRTHSLPIRRGFQVHLKMASGVLNVPGKPIDIPSGAYAIWPVNFDLGGGTLLYATAQLVAKLDNPKTYVFCATPGVAAEFVFEKSNGEVIEAAGAKVKQRERAIVVSAIKPSTKAAIKVRTAGGETIQILVLSREQAGNLWKAKLGGRERLILSAADVFVAADGMHLRSADQARLEAGVLPELNGVPRFFRGAGKEGIFDLYEARVQPVAVKAEVRQLKEAGAAPAIRIGKDGAAMAPEEKDFEQAAAWSVEVPAVKSDAVENLFLRISYEGDIGRIYDGEQLLTDNFYNGEPWVVGLGGLDWRKEPSELDLRILPLRKDAPIYLPPGSRPEFPPSEEVAKIEDVQVVPEYEAVMAPPPKDSVRLNESSHQR